MDFFEVLTEKTLEREQDRVGRSVYLSAGVQRGIAATIEALNEMTVGEPQVGIVRHWGDGRTFISYTPIDCGYQCSTTLEGHHGSDGEEVVVTVFRTK